MSLIEVMYNIFFSECGVSKIPQARIVGGNATYEGQNPWMVAIYLHGNGKKEFWCGGKNYTDLC
jgi:hypothetical protein